MQLKWGIMSCGKISGDFVEGVKLLPAEEHKIVAVSTASDAGRAQEFATKHGLKDAAAYGDYEKLCGDANVHIVYIGNWNHQHLGCVKLALSAGKHVLCEKPMAVNVKEAKEMVNLAREKNLFLMEGFWSRFFPALRELKKLVADGAIGTPKQFKANFSALFPPDNRVWDANQGGGGMAYDIGIYPLHIAMHIFGYQNFVRADFSGTLAEGKNVDQQGAIILYFAGGARAVLTFNGDSNCPSEALLVGDKEVPGAPHFAITQNAGIKICEPLWAPVALETNIGGKWERQDFPLPGSQDNFTYWNSSGFNYEAACVRNCILEGKTECPTIPLDESLVIHQILQDYRKTLGIKYPQD